MTNQDYRQRFFIKDSPVRGDIVRLTQSFQTITTQKNYPTAVKALLGQMLVSASLLMSTIKTAGRLSIQLQGNQDNALRWAMAECDHTGQVRGLADFDDSQIWQNLHTAEDAFRQIDGVLFISIHPQTGDSYQGIVEKISDNLGECLAHYQKQSAQIPTFVRLSTTDSLASGILIQLLPQSESDRENDPDLWHRVQTLASTLKDDELNELSADEILYRLYHEENVVMPKPSVLQFGCTCSKDKSAGAILQVGKDEANHALVANNGQLVLDCGFCGTAYVFNQDDINAIFE